MQGRSPKEIIDERVALEARRLLVHTRRPQQDIGHELGFRQATNFAAFFRRTVGVTPGVFRRSVAPRPPR